MPGQPASYRFSVQLYALPGYAGTVRVTPEFLRRGLFAADRVAWEGGLAFFVPSLCASENQLQGVME